MEIAWSDEMNQTSDNSNIYLLPNISIAWQWFEAENFHKKRNIKQIWLPESVVWIRNVDERTVRVCANVEYNIG